MKTEVQSEVTIRVFLRDTVTGFTHTYETSWRLYDGRFEDFWWSEGNGACDCNRLDFLTEHGKVGPEHLRTMVDNDDAPCNEGDNRVVIDKIERADTGEIVYEEAP